MSELEFFVPKEAMDLDYHQRRQSRLVGGRQSEEGKMEWRIGKIKGF